MKYPLTKRVNIAAKAFLYGLWCSIAAAVNILFGLYDQIDGDGNTINRATNSSGAQEPVVHVLPKQYIDGREVVGAVIVPGEPFYSEYIHQLMETPGKTVKIHEGHHYVLTNMGTWFRLDPIRSAPEEPRNEFEGGGPYL